MCFGTDVRAVFLLLPVPAPVSLIAAPDRYKGKKQNTQITHKKLQNDER